jgi:hypothetical protein
MGYPPPCFEEVLTDSKGVAPEPRANLKDIHDILDWKEVISRRNQYSVRELLAEE